MKNIIPYFLILLVPTVCFSAITFSGGKWETTFDYAACTQRGGGGATDCDTVKNDGILWTYGGAASVCGDYTQVSTLANYSSGAGGNGFRAFSNISSSDSQESTGAVKIEFPSAQKELWIRWYQKYQTGFNWNPLAYDKTLYIRTGASSVDVIPEFYGADGYAVIAQGAPTPYAVLSSDYGWQSVMGGATGDGQYHAYEIHIKMDTDGTNGVGQLWIDGVLKANNTAMSWSGGNATAQLGWAYFDFENNQRYIDQTIIGTCAYVDYDDMAIYNTTPPNLDANGNPFIGLYGSDTGPPATSHNGTSRSATAQTITLTPNETATTQYCTGSAACSPSLAYSAPVSVKPGKFLCYASTDSASNVEATKCFNPLWPVKCR